jgi:hypothetical protein
MTDNPTPSPESSDASDKILKLLAHKEYINGKWYVPVEWIDGTRSEAA